MDKEQIIKNLESVGAILDGHFILSSGKHSDKYIQCAKIFSYPNIAEILCKALADKLKAEHDLSNIDYILAPAMGGVIVGYEMSRQLNIPNFFCERVNNEFTLRRGFNLPKNSNVLIIEDVITTGKSSKEAINLVENLGSKAVLEASLILRCDDNFEFSIPITSLIKIKVNNYDPDNLPDYLKNIPAIKPGSRNLK